MPGARTANGTHLAAASKSNGGMKVAQLDSLCSKLKLGAFNQRVSHMMFIIKIFESVPEFG
jgi:hypothetical protein